ncbi:MAG TPA: DNA alkylation repair protein [Patescibacteria group bacterium]|jgi:3-methyladenine DNA glycosylase AlkD|nr:DNA alkylation repair protein [Patescibacteria group bacterium]
MSIQALRKDIKILSNFKKAAVSQRFFKTNKGDYGYGDKFVGIIVPVSRMLAKKHSDLSFAEIKRLLGSPVHEERLIALLVLVNNFAQGNAAAKKKIYQFYLANTASVNNWDLVDLSADKILGNYILDKPKTVLYRLVKSKNIWERRIAIVSTFHFIRRNLFADTLKLSEILLNDSHDLIHKAAGWMLREAGKRDEKVLVRFLNRHYRQMPRTMLRYAIERFPENTRKKYLAK